MNVNALYCGEAGVLGRFQEVGKDVESFLYPNNARVCVGL